MARFYLIFSLAAAAGLASATDIWGYGEHTTGGAAAPKSSIYTVTDFNELRTALDNNGAPHDPKIIYISTPPSFPPIPHITKPLANKATKQTASSTVTTSPMAP